MANTVKKQSRKTTPHSKPQIAVVPEFVPAVQTNAALIARREAAVPRGVASAAPIFAPKGRELGALGRRRQPVY